MQSCLFRCWLRSCCDVTTTPEGMCLSRTALSVLFTCWPPGPLERNVSTSHSCNKSSSDSGRLIMRVSLSILLLPLRIITALPQKYVANDFSVLHREEAAFQLLGQ